MDFLELTKCGIIPVFHVGAEITILLLFAPYAPCTLPWDRVLTRSPGARLRQILWFMPRCQRRRGPVQAAD